MSKKRSRRRFTDEFKADHPGAAASVLEGLDETLTLQRLGLGGTLYKKLRTTNAIENLNSGITTYSRNVKRWQGAKMVIRWVSAAIPWRRKRNSVVFRDGVTSRN